MKLSLFLVQDLVHSSGHVVIDLPLLLGQIQQTVVQQGIEKGRPVFQCDIQIAAELLIIGHCHGSPVFPELLHPLLDVVVLDLSGLLVKHLDEQRHQKILVDVVVLSVYRLDLEKLREGFVAFGFGLALQILEENVLCALANQWDPFGVPNVVEILQRVGIGILVKLFVKFLQEVGFLTLLLLLSSVVDVVEAYEIGRWAVRRCVTAQDSGFMASIARDSDSPYRWHTEPVPLERVANRKKLMPGDYLNEDGNFVTDRFVTYIRPLVGAMPKYVRLKSTRLTKALPEKGDHG